LLANAVVLLCKWRWIHAFASKPAPIKHRHAADALNVNDCGSDRGGAPPCSRRGLLTHRIFSG
jgi:hypothetical protein